eukprot:9489428-Pyramimonas_sp.AAC.2
MARLMTESSSISSRSKMSILSSRAPMPMQSFGPEHPTICAKDCSTPLVEAPDAQKRTSKLSKSLPHPMDPAIRVRLAMATARTHASRDSRCSSAATRRATWRKPCSWSSRCSGSA